MSEHRAPSDRRLGLLSQDAVQQILRLVAASPEPTPYRTLVRSCGSKAGRLLRALAVEGFVRRDGSWDHKPDPDTTFELTEHGAYLVELLDQLDALAHGRSTPATPHSWLHSLWRQVCALATIPHRRSPTDER